MKAIYILLSMNDIKSALQSFQKTAVVTTVVTKVKALVNIIICMRESIRKSANNVVMLVRQVHHLNKCL